MYSGHVTGARQWFLPAIITSCHLITSFTLGSWITTCTVSYGIEIMEPSKLVLRLKEIAVCCLTSLMPIINHALTQNFRF